MTELEDVARQIFIACLVHDQAPNRNHIEWCFERAELFLRVAKEKRSAAAATELQVVP